MASAETGLPDRFEPGQKKPDGSGIDPQTTRNVKWTARLGSQACGNPTVAGGKVFVGTNAFGGDEPAKGGVLRCFDEATGKPLWQFAVPRVESSGGQRLAFDDLDLGICSSPTVEDGCVYVVTNRCEVACLDVAGKLRWRYDMLARLPVFPHDAANSSILIYGDLLYVGTSNGVNRAKTGQVERKAPLPLAPSLVVLDKRTGRLVAQDGEKIGTRLFHGQWSSPSLARSGPQAMILYGGGDGLCYSFAPVVPQSGPPATLTKLWSFDCNPPEYRFQDGKRINYWNGDVRRHAGNANDGRFVGPSEIIGTPVVDQNRLYVAVGQDPRHGRGRGMLQALDVSGPAPRQLWSYDGLDRTLSTASVAGGLVYIVDVAGTVHCLDAHSGRPAWVYATKAETWGSTLVADGKLYFGTKKSFWILAAGRQLKVLAEIHLGGPVWCTPIAANGVLYVASEKYLWAVQATDLRARSK
jgi:outer membrane protein assembly factor BamB